MVAINARPIAKFDGKGIVGFKIIEKDGFFGVPRKGDMIEPGVGIVIHRSAERIRSLHQFCERNGNGSIGIDHKFSVYGLVTIGRNGERMVAGIHFQRGSTLLVKGDGAIGE